MAHELSSLDTSFWKPVDEYEADHVSRKATRGAHAGAKIANDPSGENSCRKAVMSELINVSRKNYVQRLLCIDGMLDCWLDRSVGPALFPTSYRLYQA
jgi:hypothetical protein